MSDSKRQYLPRNTPQGLWPGLWVVATPIGNLDDLSTRARTALEAADWILCEDTRRTAALFSALGFTQFLNKLHRFDAHVKVAQIEHWISELKSEKNIALVTDAGTPSVSDPGSLLVAAAHDAGVRVVPVPGVSAVPTLLSAAGLTDACFLFMGFFPRKNKDQLAALKSVKAGRVVIWFESPYRIVDTLDLLLEMLPSATVVVGRELTKVYEQIFRGQVAEVLKRVKTLVEEVGPVGEWCFALQLEAKTATEKNDLFNKDNVSDPNHLTEQGWLLALKCLEQVGCSVSDAAKTVSQQFGIPKKPVYEAALNLFRKKNTKGG